MKRLILLLYLVSVASFGQESEQQQPEDKILVYTPLPADIARQSIKPFSDYLQRELGLETVIPRGECDAYEKFEAASEALVLPVVPLWKMLTEKGYTRLVETGKPFELLGISKQIITALEDFKGKRVAVDHNYLHLHRAIVEGDTQGIWSTIEIIDATPPNFSHVRVLKGEADYGLISAPVWSLTTSAIKERMHTIQIFSQTPKGLIMAHPQLSEERKQRYQRALMTMDQNPEVKQWLDKLTVERYVAPKSETAAFVERLPSTIPFENCWGNNLSE